MSPGFDRNTVSTMVSRWHRVFVALGYPELDLREYPDGEKAIIQYMHTPIIPSLTRWQPVLSGLRNVEITPAYLKYWAEKLNLQGRAVWEGVEASERENIRQLKEEERRAEDFAERAKNIVMRTPDLLERVAKRGTKELDMRRIANNIPRYKLGAMAKDWKEKN